ncbi:hypothetical protein GCM10010094_72770 [Streptomyces flaveus]|uniref:Uncharacterized protein n=1 Tax=Streptomyces flaveus TaxID=66370 RepID=A0A917VMZ4_9ACTN|nr:hypothetical protein GCM10010094_72770 [Streptomyces flaveus]
MALREEVRRGRRHGAPHDALGDVEDHRVHPCGPACRRHLQTDEPGPDDHHVPCRTQPGAQLLGVLDRAQGQHSVQPGTGDGERTRARTCGEHKVPVLDD